MEFIQKRFRWIPSSDEEFAASEKKLVSYLSDSYDLQDVDAGKFTEVEDVGWLNQIIGGTPKTTTRHVSLRTLFVNKTNPGTPLILLNGLGMGCAIFASMIKTISYPGPVIAVDLPGFARSTKLKFPKNAKDAESMQIKVLEGWRSNLGLEKFVLIGLSFGGFIATCYAMRHPERVVHLVVIDPWGFVEKPKQVKSLIKTDNSIVIRLMAMGAAVMNIFTIYRLLGPWGPWAFYGTGNFDDFNKGLDHQLGVEGAHKVMNDYAYHCIAVSNPTGEEAYHWMSKWIVYAQNPLCRRLNQLNVPTTMIVAEKSWVPKIDGEDLKRDVNPECRLNYIMIPSATHENIIVIKEFEETLCNIINKEGWAKLEPTKK